MLNNVKSTSFANHNFHFMLHTHAKKCFVLKLCSSYTGIGPKVIWLEDKIWERNMCHIYQAITELHIPTSLSYPHLRQAWHLAPISRDRILLLNSYFKCGHSPWGGGEGNFSLHDYLWSLQQRKYYKSVNYIPSSKSPDSGKTPAELDFVYLTLLIAVTQRHLVYS